MATNFPTGLDSITNPAGTDQLSVPVGGLTHSQLLAKLADAVEALEAKVGVDSSAVTSSLDYKTTANGLLTGSGVPAGGTGVNTNLYLDTASGIIYRKTAGTWAAIYTPSAGGGSGFPFSNGCAAYDPHIVTGTSAVTAGTLRLVGFIAPNSVTVGNMSGYSNSGVSVTLGKYGIYTLNAAGDGTLVAQTASHTGSQGGGGVTTYALTAPYALVSGQRYAFALLFVGGSPAFGQAATGVAPAMSLGQPFKYASLAAQTDLPASFTFAALTVNGIGHYLEATT